MHTVTTLFALLVSAAPAGPVRLAAPGLTSPDIEAARLSFYSEHLAQQLVARGLEVVTAKDINSLLSNERQKELLGCGEAIGSCMAELANALGTDAIVNGELAKVGNGYQVNLKVIAAGDGKRLATYSARATGEDTVLDQLNEGATVLTQGVLAALRPAEQVTTSTSQSLRPVGWVGIGVGAATLVTGVGALIFSQLQLAKLRPAEPIAISDAEGFRESGKTAQLVGWVCVATGAVLAAAGAVVVKLGAPTRPAVTLQVGTNGSSVVVWGTF